MLISVMRASIAALRSLAMASARYAWSRSLVPGRGGLPGHHVAEFVGAGGELGERDDLRVVEPTRDLDTELRLLAGRWAQIVADQTRRAARIRDLLAGIHPGLERAVDVTTAPASR
jgi:hypothetical protein